MSDERAPRSVQAADLLGLVPSLLAGARALRERERWSRTVAFIQIDAVQAGDDAEVLERFAHWVDPRPPEPRI